MDISCCDIVAEANIIILFMKVMFILRISVFEWYVDVEWINGDGAAQPLPVIAMKNILTIHAEPMVFVACVRKITERQNRFNIDFHSNQNYAAAISRNLRVK